jgi:hypothetical protein
MKIKKADVEKRREFMRTLIRKDPKMSGSKLNALLFKEFGTKLRINTVYDLKEELGYDRNGEPKRPGGAPAAAAVAARNVGETAAGVFPLLVPTTANDKPIEFAERVLARLQAAGVINLKVSGHGDTWMVIEQAV